MGQCRTTATYLLHLQVAQLGGRTPDFYRFPIKASGKKGRGEEEEIETFFQKKSSK